MAGSAQACTVQFTARAERRRGVDAMRCVRCRLRL